MTLHPGASLFLALRYLKPRRSLVSVITLLSVVGPILGVAVLIIVIAVMAGFSRDIREKILGMQAHLQIRDRVAGQLEDPEPLLARLRTYGVAASPVVEGPVLIQTHRRVLAKYVKGIDPQTETKVSDLHRHVVAGSYEIGEDEVLVGRELALECGLGVGDRLIIHSPEKLNRMVSFNEDGSVRRNEQRQEVYVPEEVTVAGVFSIGMYEYDSSVIIMHLDRADELFGLAWGAASAIHVRSPDPFDLEPLRAELAADPAFEGLSLTTWQEANRRLFGALRVEKNLMFFLLIFIVVVAAFGIAGTLITVVIEKTREIGVLKAMGATPLTILMVFILQGAVVGMIGTVLGTGLGLLVVRYRNVLAGLMGRVMGVEIFPRDLYQLSRIPALVESNDLVVIVSLAFSICVAAALVPALYAATLTPTEALRAEGPG